MSDGDKRKVSTDALETLGTIIGPNEKRDAIHLAVIPAVAGQYLPPNSHVALVDGMALQRSKETGAIGIVDPFLPCAVDKGQHFWLVIYPRVITSLRHVWTHPELPDEVGAEKPKSADVVQSEAWLRAWCSDSDISYEQLIEIAKSGKADFDKGDENAEYYSGPRWEVCDWDSSYLLSRGRDACGGISPEVWNHAAIVIGREPFARPQHFTCSC